MTCPLANRRPGEYPLEALPDQWVNARVSKESRRPRIEILDPQHRTRYRQEPLAIIAWKCAMLLVGTPFYCLAYTAIHLIRLPIVALSTLSPLTVAKQVWKIARTPFYGIALWFSALYGVVKPLEGRALFGKWEKKLHDGKGLHQSLQKSDLPLSQVLWETFAGSEIHASLFLGFCMQPIGEVTPEIQVKILPNPAPSGA